MSRTTEPSPAADGSASDRDDTTVDPTPPGGIARGRHRRHRGRRRRRCRRRRVCRGRRCRSTVEVDVPRSRPLDDEVGGETDQNFRVLDVPIITAETVVVVPEEPVEPPVVVADPDPKRPIRSMLGPRDLVQAISTLIVAGRRHRLHVRAAAPVADLLLAPCRRAATWAPTCGRRPTSATTCCPMGGSSAGRWTGTPACPCTASTCCRRRC